MIREKGLAAPVAAIGLISGTSLDGTVSGRIAVAFPDDERSRPGDARQALFVSVR